ncbi:aromatic ring-hydroxylating dioxygenase subunit alpha [Phenylobacterium sp.]|jgi:phenylpropionate dioxygenase-like ring-hydroxylating dioxygenase large terminal subunit|uniref:aromatic ring-hydroxylating oxygenase subunit alpha n=1 Tax=Phenylobacterium sp. TaxID=1871053 RepID=UPI002F41120B
MADDRTVLPLGAARCPGVSWDDLAAADSRPMPEFLSTESYRYLGSEPLSADRYTDPGFFAREVERMWPNVWQYAARDEDMPEPGDFIVYENVGRSYLVVRQADGSVRAFHNVCLHRGRKLKTEAGWANRITCPYHAFSWNTDGTLHSIPCAWDFGHLDRAQMSLPDAQADSWAGYIFVKENPGGPSLLEYLAPLPEQFARWRQAPMTTTVHVAKVLNANWKAVMEAFMEAWHSTATHPQILAFTGDANGRNNIFGDHVNFGIAPVTLSPSLDRKGRDEQWQADVYFNFAGRGRLNRDEPLIVPPGGTARATLGERSRRDYSRLYGIDLDHATDCEMLDSLFYSVFPNFGPWGGFKPNLDYRFRPWPDQDHTLFEVRILSRAQGQALDPPPPMRVLAQGEPWVAAADVLGQGLAEVLDQDVGNVEQVHAGLRASKNRRLQLGNYLDIRIRHFHTTLDKYLADRP